MTIEVGKTYSTWDEGHTFKVLCVGEHRAFGIHSAAGEISLAFSALRGETPQKLEGEVWVNVYKKDGVITFGFPHKTKKIALDNIMSNCIDTISVYYKEK